MRTLPRSRTLVRALLSMGLAAYLLWGAGILAGCKRKRTVRFIEACAVYSQPNTGSGVVGRIRPQRPYEVLAQKEEWYRVEVFENRVWGWTPCPTTD
jgi:hypothetical protein